MEKKKYISEYDELDKLYRNAWKPLHENISDYILPRRGNFVDRGKPYTSQNVNRADYIINNTATRANRILGSGMQGGLCSPSRRWFKLALNNTDLEAFTPIKLWLETAENIIYKIYSNTNFYTSIHRVFEEEGGFGTSVLLQEEDYNNILNFQIFNPGEYRLALGPTGKIDTCYRHFWMEAINMINMFGEGNVSEGVRRHAATNPHEYFEVVHAIRPNTKRNILSSANAEMPYSSCWFETAGNEDKFLRNSGYNERPFSSPRWTEVGNSPYGLGPGTDCLGGVMMLQEMEKTALKAIHKEVDPPLAVSSAFKDTLNQLPGAINWFDGDAKNAGGALLNIQYNIKNAEYKIEKIEARIERDFYNDIFTMIINAEATGRSITATEILERKEEKLVLLGPTVERQTTELFDSIIGRTFNILFRAGMFPPPPEELQDQDISIKYVGVLAQAQRLSDAQNMRLYAEDATAIQQLDPLTRAVTNWNVYLQELGDIYGVPKGIVRAPGEVEEMQAAMIEAQEQEEREAELANKINMMKEASRADTGSENVLTDMAGGG